MLKIKKVNYDENFEYGCETCDYGSSYVNEIEIIFEDDTYTNIKVDRMYKYALTESDYMQLIANSNNIDDFCVNIIKKLKNDRYDKNLRWLLELEDLTIKINGEDIDILKTLGKGRVIKKCTMQK